MAQSFRSDFIFIWYRGCKHLHNMHIIMEEKKNGKNSSEK